MTDSKPLFCFSELSTSCPENYNIFSLRMNLRITWVGRDFKGHLTPPALNRQGSSHFFQVQVVSFIPFNGTTCRVRHLKEVKVTEFGLLREETHYESCSFAQGGSQRLL